PCARSWNTRRVRRDVLVARLVAGGIGIALGCLRLVEEVRLHTGLVEPHQRRAPAAASRSPRRARAPSPLRIAARPAWWWRAAALGIAGLVACRPPVEPG